MNLEKVFEFIKEKRGYDVPLKYKLINGLQLSEDELNVSGDLNLKEINIKFLPDNLTVEGYLFLSETNIKSLPDNLTVGGDLYLRYTNITSLPDNLKVGDSLFLGHTPLSNRFSKEEIRKMIEDKGGYVKGHILR